MIMNYRLAAAGAAFLLAACSGGGNGTSTTPATSGAVPESHSRHIMSAGSTPASGSWSTAYHQEKCSTGNDPPNPQWYYVRVATADSGGNTNYTTASTTAAPTSSATAIGISLSVPTGAISVKLTDPNGTVVLDSGTSGSTFVSSYYAAGAPAGTYTLTVGGVTWGDCGITTSSGTGVVSSWSGTLSWH